MKRPTCRFLLTLAIAVFLLSLLPLAPDKFLADEPALRTNPAVDASTNQVATFAGGCFWCMESPFDKMDGVISTTSGYTGGRTENPVYDQVKFRASTFYPAEEYHQDYYKKNPTKYKFYRYTCGRDARLDVVWGAKARQP